MGMSEKKKYQYWGSKPRYRRSTFEKKVEADLKERGVRALFEPRKFNYVKFTSYTPDFVLPNGIALEVKGWFLPEDRTKLKNVKLLYPNLDLRIIFASDNKINKNSATRYSDWCKKNGFLYAFKTVPQEWLEEPEKEFPRSMTRHELLKHLIEK